jgi:ABC-type nitrate/sulfonate/bicarbonate transport system permease component
MPAFIRTLLQAIIGLALVGVIWLIAAIVLDDPIRLPMPGAALAKAIELAASEDYFRHIEESGTALVFGLTPALLAGVLLGILARVSSGMRWLIGPFAVALAAAPLVALVPAFVLWWGLTITTKAVAVFVVALFASMNMVMVSAGAKRHYAAGPDEEPVKAEGGGTARAIFCGLRIGVAFGVTALIVCEFMASTRGVGYFIMNSASTFETTSMMAGVILVLVPTVLVVALLQAIEEQIAV